MSEQREALAEVLRAAWRDEWANRPNGLVMNGLADALLASPALARLLADAEQRGVDMGEANADTRYTETEVHAACQRARAEAWEEAHDRFCSLANFCSTHMKPGDRHLLSRAALGAAEPADWASAVNAASLRAVKTLHASAVLTEHWSCDGQTEGATVRWSCGIETPSGPSPRQAHLAYALAAAEPDAGER